MLREHDWDFCVGKSKRFAERGVDAILVVLRTQPRFAIAHAFTLDQLA